MSAFDPFRTLGGAATVTNMATIYMPLLNEGTDVWRPVEATHLEADSFRVEGPVPEDEEWMFAPGSLVRCELRTLSPPGDYLVAVQAIK